MFIILVLFKLNIVVLWNNIYPRSIDIATIVCKMFKKLIDLDALFLKFDFSKDLLDLTFTGTFLLNYNWRYKWLKELI